MQLVCCTLKNSIKEDKMVKKAEGEKLAKLIEIAKKRGIKVDDVTKEVLAYFGGGNCLVYFHASGFSHQSPDLMKKLSSNLGLDYLDVSTAATILERRGMLEETRGMSSVGGREYWYGLAEWVNDELKRVEVKSKNEVR